MDPSEPPQDEPASLPLNEWDTPPAAADPLRRAATLLWVLGVVNILVFGCASMSMGLVLKLPPEELHRVAPYIPPERVEEMRASLWPIIVRLLFIGVIPGAVYLVAGFGVRAGRTAPTAVALLLTTTQLIVWGVMLLMGLAQSANDGNPTQMTLQVLTLGSFIALLAFTIHWLLQAWPRRRLAAGTGTTDPWDHQSR